MNEPLRISLWSGPRNISTALMYSFAQRSDTTVVDEPFYAYYLAQTKARFYHPGADEIIAAMETDRPKIIQNVILGNYDTPIVFFKNMTHHLPYQDEAFLDRTVNILLTRDPHDMLHSYVKTVANPSLADTGYAAQLDLFNDLRSRGQNPPVLDAKQVLLNPRQVLSKLCDRINSDQTSGDRIKIAFDQSMLSWGQGPRSEDGIWAKHWYHNVHQSTGFQPYQSKVEPFPEALKPLLAECMPYYEQLSAFAIQAEAVLNEL